MARKTNEPAQSSFTFEILLPVITAVIILFSVFIKPQGLDIRQKYSVDEILYNVMADQMTVNFLDYTPRPYYELMKKYN